jgi:hypothetical protein
MATIVDYLGKALNLKKPDGTPLIALPTNSTINTGAVANISKLVTSKATDILKNGVSSVIPDTKTTAGTAVKNLPALVKNPMEQFASSSVLWTMSCLTPLQYNNPTTYRNSPQDLKNVIFSSGGRFDSQRTKTFYGAPEYFINNFQMNCLIGASEKTGNSNAIKFSFDIYEPYSMGLLLQSMQLAAVNAGYLNYIDNAPYLLKMDIVGYDELGQVIKSVKPKFFPMKLISVKFSVNEGGSSYKIEAMPYNHQGFADNINTTYSDLKLVGDPKGVGNVVELLSTGKASLAAALNHNENKLKDDGKIGIPDQYYIEFPEIAGVMYSNGASVPTVKGATASPSALEPKNIVGGIGKKEDIVSKPVNSIGTASLGFDQSTGGNQIFKRSQDQIDDKTGLVKRDGMTIDPKLRAFQFGQSQTLTSIINQIVLSSDYAAKAIDPANTENGFIKWFKLDVQIQLLDIDPVTGDYAKKIIYRVVPYLVHQSIFANPSSAPIGYAELQKQVAKDYQYIYTGQNVDVLKFDVTINNLFYAGVAPKAEKDGAKVSLQDQGGTTERTNNTTETGQGQAPGAQAAQAGRARPRRDPKQLAGLKGGSGIKSVEQSVAENFQQAFISGNSVDLVSVSLEILGDPYWLIDSGIGNYFAGVPSQQSQITNDGTMNYESGNVYIYLTFRTPVDINEKTGTYDFSIAGKESPFGGIYRVNSCENHFQDGTWRQKLKCLRMPGPQGPETNKTTQGSTPLVIAKADSSATEITEPAAPRSSNIAGDTGNSTLQPTANPTTTPNKPVAGNQLPSTTTTTTSNQVKPVTGFRYYRDIGKQ